VTASRRPKVPVEEIRAITTRVSAAVPGDAVGEFAYGDYAPGRPLGPGDPAAGVQGAGRQGGG